MAKLIEYTSKGMYCKEGDFYVDPHGKVSKAIITHAHTDHAKPGSEEYWCAEPLQAILRHRIGKKGKINAIPYGKKIMINNTLVSFHPAGHMLGSSQIRIECGEVWVVSGDYKREADPSCHPFELVPCDVFITEATFAMPIYEWPESSKVVKEMHDWYIKNKRKNISSVLLCYSLGKAQRVLGELAPLIKDQIYVHKAIEPYIKFYEEQGIVLAKTSNLESSSTLNGSLIIAPPFLKNTSWLDNIDYKTALVSGWAHTYNPFTQNAYDTAFTLSDHADWPSLIRTIKETKAKQIYIMHGKEAHLMKYLAKEGIKAEPLKGYIPFTERTKKGQLKLSHFFS